MTAALLLSFPAAGMAEARQTEQGESSATALSSAGLLERGAGYGSRDGSPAVKALQVRLRRLGHAPGPVDGLFGPLTEAAVERFQSATGLAVDGVVGPRTRGRLLPSRPKSPPAASEPAEHPPRAPLVTEPRELPRPVAGPEPEPSGLAPGYAALLGALAAALACAGLWALRGRRRAPARPARMNLGMVGAALLAVFAVGAAGGAVFATQAAPGDLGEAPAPTLRATTPDPPRTAAQVRDPAPRRTSSLQEPAARTVPRAAGQPARRAAGTRARARASGTRTSRSPAAPPAVAAPTRPIAPSAAYTVDPGGSPPVAASGGLRQAAAGDRLGPP